MSTHTLTKPQAKAASNSNTHANTLLQRKCACGSGAGLDGMCESCREARLQRRSANCNASQMVPQIVHEFLPSSGQPLDQQVRAFFKPSLGCCFSQTTNPGSGTQMVNDRFKDDIVGRSEGAGEETTTGTETEATVGSPAQQAVACPNDVNFSTDPHHAQTPSCGTQAVQARTVPLGVGGVSWSLLNGTAIVDAGTTISNNGRIFLGVAQTGGSIKARAEAPSGCWAERELLLRSHPTGINNTFEVAAAANPAVEYGAVYDHVLNSNDGNVASLENVPVGERFIGVPAPTAATHTIPNTPFGQFTLNTATLTPNATNNWFLTASGELGGTHDSVTMERAGVNVGRFLRSASNATPPQALPASFTLRQGLHWFCRHAPANARWQMPAFRIVDHTRSLRQNGGAVEFAVSVNNIEHVDTYDGSPGIFNARALTNPVPKSPVAGPANTSQISADTLPNPLPPGHSLQFSIQGNARGCTINPGTGQLTVGQQAGQVRIRISDTQTNQNFDEVSVQIVEQAT